MTKSQKTEYYRNKLVDSLLCQKIISKVEIEKAFRKVKRDLFLPGFPLKEIYTDGSIITKSIGTNYISSSTSPSLMASMIEILDLKKGHKVLEIGTGTGYNAAILAEIVADEKKVYSLDIDKETVLEAKRNLKKAGYQQINLLCRDANNGWNKNILFDRIIFTASVKKIPPKIINQLRIGGIVVLPFWINGTQITPALKKKKDGSLYSQKITLGGFMPLREKTITQIKKLSDSKDLKRNILICSENLTYFNYNKLLKFLKTKPKIIPNLFKGLSLPRAGNFFRFLATREKKSVEIFIEKSSPSLFIKDSGAGIIDLSHNSGCLFLENNQIQNYGNDFCFNKIQKLYQEWLRLASPDVDRFQITFPNDLSHYHLSILKRGGDKN